MDAKKRYDLKMPVCNFRMKAGYKNALQKLAAKNDTNLNKLIAEIVEDYLKRENIIIEKIEINI